MKIGNLSIENRFFLAPMAGITDKTFRLLCKRCGCGLTYTEMISEKKDYFKERVNFNNNEDPIAIQILGSDPFIIKNLIKQIEEIDRKNIVIDINMGCPSKKVVENGDGAALMRNPKLVGEIVRSMVKATKLPVTVKMRKGWDQNEVNACEIAKIVEDSGAKAIAIHGRTREQFYNGKADWEIIERVKDCVSLPVIGNGDVFSPKDALDMISSTGCDGVMIGRAAIGDPWIFQRCIHFFETGELLPPPMDHDKLDLLIEHIGLIEKSKGDFLTLKIAKKLVPLYFNNKFDALEISNYENINDLMNYVSFSIKTFT